MRTKLKNRLKENRKKYIAVLCIALVLVLVVVLVTNAVNNVTEEEGYRETTVVCGNLTVGITESGTVDIGTVDQTFDLDMSALKRVTTSSSSSNSSSGSSGFGGMGGGQSMGAGFGGGMGGGSASPTSSLSTIFTGGSSGSSQDGDSELIVAEIKVSVGQSVKAGDTLLVLEEEGVSDLRDELKQNVDKASADLEALEADQNLSRTTAQYTYDSSIAYGEYAETEKNSTIASLKEAVETAQTKLDTAKKTLSTYQSKLDTLKADFANAQKLYDNYIWLLENTGKTDNPYTYTVYFNEYQSVFNTYNSLDNQVTQMESKVEQAENNVTTCQQNLDKATRSYESGLLSAQETYDLRMLAYENAQETYDITIAYLADSLKEQQELYDETAAKWNEFTTYIDGNEVKAEYDGVITSIGLEVGDKLTTKATVVTMYDANEVSMTVSVDEDDMTDIEKGGLANISLTAYPDRIFTAVVSDIGDATTDKSGNTTVDVTVTIQGDVSNLFQGMTGDITFITKELQNVLYVSNRAIVREGGRSYVKVLHSDGSTERREIVTGFSDGSNVEIVSGLSEGDIVLIEKGE